MPLPFLNEDVTIPPELANQYLSVKKQIANKQGKKDQLMKSVNQLDNEINILTKNLIAIESKAAQQQGDEQESTDNQARGTQTIEIEGNVKESIDLDEWWKKNVTESIEEDDPNLELATDNIEDDLDDELYNEDPDDDSSEALEGDYSFSLKIIDEDEEEDIIVKFYRDDDGDFWKARVVQGSEEPIESMQFDPEMEMIDIIEHLATMFDEIEQIDVDDYEEMLDDKEEIDDIYYDDILK